METIVQSLALPGVGTVIVTDVTPTAFVPGDLVLIEGHSGSDPDLNGEHTVVAVYLGNYMVIAGEVDTGGTGGTLTPVNKPSVIVPLQFRRGNTAQLAAYTGGLQFGGTAAEPVWDALRRELRIADGTLQGGTLIGPVFQRAETTVTTLSGGAEERCFHLEGTLSSGSNVAPRMWRFGFGPGADDGGIYCGPAADDTATGGRIRGVRAIDLQMHRTAATQVAAGARSVILGGAGNSTTVGGPQSVAMGTNAVGRQINALAQASGRFADDGDAQAVRYVARASSASATPVTLVSVQGVSDTTTAFDIRVVARSANGADSAFFHRRIVTRRVGSGTTAIVGSMQTIGTDIKSAGAAAWDLDYNAPNNVRAIGVAATNIRWVAQVEAVEVGFPA